MKIAVSASVPTLDATIDPRFGRCPHFLLVDPETMEFESIANGGASAGGGAGIAAAQQVAGKGPEAVLTGNCGPNAFGVLEAAGIKVFTGISGSVKEAVESYKAGGLQPSTQASVSAHSGMSRGQRS